jgi:hypothetical protein
MNPGRGNDFEILKQKPVAEYYPPLPIEFFKNLVHAKVPSDLFGISLFHDAGAGIFGRTSIIDCLTNAWSSTN